MVELITGLITGISWLASLPDWFKYLIFLSSVMVVSAIEGISGVQILNALFGDIAYTITGVNIAFPPFWVIGFMTAMFPLFFYALKH